jgi:hypothetical protein
MIYAQGSASRIRDLALARSAAASRARSALAGPRAGKDQSIPGSEVIDVYHCKGEVHALARMRVPHDGPARAPACDDTRIAPRTAQEGSCPLWTQQVVRRDGDQLTSVGLARMRNRALAEATAANRARAELTRFLGVKLHEDALQTTGKAYSAVAKNQAYCEDYAWVMLVQRELEEVSHSRASENRQQ